MRNEAVCDKKYFPKSKMIYVEFDDYEEFHTKSIYKSVFRKLKRMDKIWKDLNYASGIDWRGNWDTDDTDDSNDSVESENFDTRVDPKITFGKEKLRELKQVDYETNTILFGFSIDLKDYEPNLYGRNEDPETLCHNSKTADKSSIYWCGIPYTEGCMAVGNFCTHIVYNPNTKYFRVDGECG